MKTSIISPEWLHQRLDDKNLIILDGTLPNQLAKMSPEIQNIQIPKARFFDVKYKFSDVSDKYPTAYPSVSQFENEAQNLGINSNNVIVVYDANGIYSSPRVWWLFKSMGHDEVYVLNGGLPAWLKSNFSTEKKSEKTFLKGDFKAKPNTDIVRKFKDIFNNLSKQEELIIDVRSEGRFNGTIPEPKEGLRSGQINNSINFPYTKVLKNGSFKTPEELKSLFQFLESEKRRVVFSCGSGITACVVYLAMNTVLNQPKAVYDGSWTEWGDKVKE